MKSGKIRIGVVGAGGFGLFALQHFTQIPGVELLGIARAVLRDQIQRIYDRSHARKLTHQNGATRWRSPWKRRGWRREFPI